MIRIVIEVSPLTRCSCLAQTCFKTSVHIFFDFVTEPSRSQWISKNVSSGEGSRGGPASFAVLVVNTWKHRSARHFPYYSLNIWRYLIPFRVHQRPQTNGRSLRRRVPASSLQGQRKLLRGQFLGLVRHRGRSRYLLSTSH